MTFDRSEIPGWGADLDRQNRSAMPTRPPTNDGHWAVPLPQPQTVEVFHSIERPGLTPVFGTACPPQGASGALRRAAYAGYSEDDARHWMMLMLADRVDVVEHMMGAALKSPRTRTATLLGLAGLTAAAVWYYRRGRNAPVPHSKALVPVEETPTAHAGADGTPLPAATAVH